jgi:hypothetical protein
MFQVNFAAGVLPFVEEQAMQHVRNASTLPQPGLFEDDLLRLMRLLDRQKMLVDGGVYGYRAM